MHFPKIAKKIFLSFILYGVTKMKITYQPINLYNIEKSGLSKKIIFKN